MSEMNSRERRRRKKKQRKIAITVMGILIVLLAAAAFYVTLQAKKNQGGDESSVSREASSESLASSSSGSNQTSSQSPVSSAGSSGSSAASAGSATGSAASPAASSVSDSAVSGTSVQTETVSLIEDEKYTGDLILINADQAYDFERNASSIDLKNIRESQSFSYPVGKEEFQVAGRVLSSLDAMIAACDQAMGTSYTGISSAYRTKEYQQQVWDDAVKTYGESYAEKYVAVPGFSEHHTGLAVDLGIFYDDGSEGSFSESDNAVWMKDNSWHYGFIRRYAEDKQAITKISNEAWHFRYVGVPHAAYMYANNLCLEEYLDYLKNNTSQDAPLSVTCDTGTFSIFYTADKTIRKPEGVYELSGDNSSGYIVTIAV